MNVSEIMSREVVFTQPNCPLDEAIRMFETHRFRHLPVVDNGRLVGMISDRDISLATGWILSSYRATEGGGAPERVEEIMSRNVHSLPAGATVVDAAEMILENRISAVPLLEGGVVVGLISTTDLVRTAADLGSASDWKLRDGAKVDDWMSTKLKSVTPETSMLDALDLCKRTGVRHLPVLEQGKLVGMISDRDLRFGLGQEIAEDQLAQDEGRMDALGTPLAALMSTEVVTIGLGASLQTAAEVMLKHGFSSLPVTSGGKVVGMLTQTDLLRSCC